MKRLYTDHNATTTLREEVLGGLPPIKVHCSLLTKQAIKAAEDDYRSKADAP